MPNSIPTLIEKAKALNEEKLVEKKVRIIASKLARIDGYKWIIGKLEKKVADIENGKKTITL